MPSKLPIRLVTPPRPGYRAAYREALAAAVTCQNGYPCTNGRIDPSDGVTTAFASHFESIAEVSVADAIYVETVGISGGDAARARAARLRGLAAGMRDLDILAAAGTWNTLLADVSAEIGASKALLAGQPEGWPAFDCPEVRRRGAVPLSRTNTHAYTNADGNRAVGLSQRLRLDRSADRFPRSVT